MITHENLAQAVYEDNHNWSCEGCCDCNTVEDCMTCCENKLIEYENALREEGKRMVLADLAEHDKDVRKKFAEWVDNNYETEHYIPSLVEFYEKEQKGETE